MAPAQPGDSITNDGRVVGTITSAAFGHRTCRNLAMGYIDAAHAEIGTAVQVALLGKSPDATIIPHGPYDPTNALLAGYGRRG